MNRSLLAVLSVSVILVAGAGIAFVVMNDNDDRETITVTMSWEKSLVEDIVGDHYRVVSMMPSNVSPHEAYSTPSNIADLNSSKVFFKIGSGVEWETAFFEAVSSTIPKEVVIADIAANVDYVALPNTHHHHHEGEHDDDDDDEEDEHDHESATDAHIWTSPTILRGIATYVAKVMCDVDPDHAAEYNANLAAYNTKVDKVDDLMAEVATIAGPDHTHILVWHPAWQYLLNQYSREARFGAELCQEAIETEGEVTPSQAIAMMTEDGHSVIYLSVTDDGYEGCDAIKEAGLKVRIVNPTADDMLESITEFLGYLKEDLKKA